jgi:vancomycin resistance protein YoaR
VAAALAVVVLAALAALDARATVPGGVQIDGVDVGGSSPRVAERTVTAHAEQKLDEPILLVGPGTTSRTTGRALAARPRVAEAVADAGVERFGFVRSRILHTKERDVALRWDIGRDAVISLAPRLGRRLAARDAAVIVDAAGVTVRPGRPGRTVDLDELLVRLERLPRVVHVPMAPVVPSVTTEAARAAAARVTALTAVPRTIELGRSTVTLNPSALRQAVRVDATGRGLVVAFDADLLRPLLPRSTRPRDATLRIRGTRVEIVPSAPGLTVDAVATARTLAASSARTIDAPARETAPKVTAADLAALRIRERISEFTTYFPPGQPRVTNIKRASSVIDGTILRPGETFFMNEVLGERTIAKGYVPAPQISDDAFVEAPGGGISQVATMLYNGAFFAGLELIEHTPHSIYIDRYPLGREATISWGGPELIFRNDWPAGLLIKLETTDSSITVRFYSSKLGRRVETETAQPYGSGGGGGFSVRYPRRVYRGDRLTRDEVFVWRYRSSEE